MKNSLSKKGLSMSEASSISNICNQKALDITNILASINNYSKTVTVEKQEYDIVKGKPMPDNVVELILEKSRYHATQAFLMENIKAKDALIKEVKGKEFSYDVASPEIGKLASTNLLSSVGKEWAKNQLSLEEANDFLLQETIAAHVGQAIHNRSVLDTLRKELPTIQLLEWMEVEAGKKTPVVVEVHHTAEKLSVLHEEFSAIHREAEQKVNYIKAKMENLMTLENARIAEVNSEEVTRVSNLNASIREDYTNANKQWREDYKAAEQLFEAKRNKEVQEAAALKIKTAPQFQKTVDEILELLKK
jgi:hypothetical protein